MKDRDRAALAAYRHALAGIDNAEAVLPVGGVPSAGALEQAATGVGATEVARRELSEADIRAVVESELAEHRHAAATLAEHDAVRAGSHRRAAELLEQVLAS